MDEIFQQLGGFSFEERQERELKKKLYERFHQRNWRTNQIEEQFEVNGSTLKLDGECGQRYGGDFELYSGGKHILYGIAHYEFGSVKLADTRFSVWMGYECPQEQYVNSSKVEKIKCFKNRRVDIKFVDAATCNDFVDRYLRTEITEV